MRGRWRTARLLLGIAVLALALAELSGSPPGVTADVGGAPAPPDWVTATRGDGTLDVSWAPVDGADSYNVNTSDDGKGSWARAQSGVTATSTTVSGVNNSAAYAAAVQAVNAAGAGEMDGLRARRPLRAAARGDLHARSHAHAHARGDLHARSHAYAGGDLYPGAHAYAGGDLHSGAHAHAGGDLHSGAHAHAGGDLHSGAHAHASRNLHARRRPRRNPQPRPPRATTAPE